jgi:transposase
MNATITSTKTTTTSILAIDLGKYKSVACSYNPATTEAQFTTIATTRDELERLLIRVQTAVVVIEACTLTGWVYDLCVRLGLSCKVANTASEAWKFKHAKRKTDKDDALRLAQLEALGQLPTVTVPSKEIREWRSLIATRAWLVGRRVAVQNRIRAILLSQGMPVPRGQRAWSELGLQGLEQYSRPLADCAPDELWRGLLALTLTEYRQLVQLIETTAAKLDARAKQDESVQILESIPGVGPRTAETVTAYLGEPKRFATGKQVSAYGGLVPRQFQSGELDRRGRITRRGPALLRKVLVECAWGMLRHNAWARAVYQRLTHGGKTHKKQAIVALARKILVRCWAMLRDRTLWRPELALSAASATGS